MRLPDTIHFTVFEKPDPSEMRKSYRKGFDKGFMRGYLVGAIVHALISYAVDRYFRVNDLTIDPSLESVVETINRREMEFWCQRKKQKTTLHECDLECAIYYTCEDAKGMGRDAIKKEETDETGNV